MSENPHNVSPRYEDEISLYDLYRILAEKNAILISTIIITLLAATAYLYIVPPTYEAKLRLLLPKPSALVLSMPTHPSEFDANTVFQGFQVHLRSMEQWRQFAAASPELSSPEIRTSQSNFLLDHHIKFSKDKSYPVEHMDIAFQHEESSAASLIMSGYIEFSRNQAKFEAAIDRQVAFAQDNRSRSVKNVLRGLHDQIQQPQGKLVRVVQGKVFDVAVVIRKSLPTIGKWVGEILSAENEQQSWVPGGFAHSFVVLSDTAEFLYKTTDHYAPEHERSIAWNDPAIAIQWPNDVEPVLSAKDQQGKSPADAEHFA